MLSKKMTEKLVYQINREMFSGYLYLGMSSFASSIGLAGIANWFFIQTQEEFSHANKIYDYVNQQGQRVILDAIEKPEQDFKTPAELFKKTLEHEKTVTGLINDLVTLSREEKDYATESFLKWFIDEQVEEEANASDLVQKMELIGDDKNGLLMFDADLAKRVFVAPTA